MAQLPYFDIHAPIVRFTKEQLAPLARHTGIVEIVGLDEAPDGSFGTVRIIFEDERVMNRYLEAGFAALGKPAS